MKGFTESPFRIYWAKEARKIKCDATEWNEIAQDLAANYAQYYVRTKNGWNKTGAATKTCIEDWFLEEDEPLKWTFERSNKLYSIYIAKQSERLDENGFHDMDFEIVYCNMSDHDSVDLLSGGDAFHEFNDVCKEVIGMTVDKACGSLKGSRKLPKDDSWRNIEPKDDIEREILCYKRACPPRLLWYDLSLWHEKTPCYNKADISSAYPSVAGKLYDHKTRLIVEGNAEEVMRAYPDYGLFIGANTSIAIERDSFDSRKIVRHKKMQSLTPEMKAKLCMAEDDTLWYIMKASPLDFSKAWQIVYDRKAKGDPVAKAIMNKTIGCYESISTVSVHSFKGFHSIVIYYRHLKKMLDYCDALEARGNEIVHLAIDSIGWIGQPEPDITSKEKKLGALVSEYEDSKIALAANGRYAIQTPTGEIFYKVQGASKVDIEAAGGIHCLDDIFKKFPRVKACEQDVVQGIEIPVLMEDNK